VTPTSRRCAKVRIQPGQAGRLRRQPSRPIVTNPGFRAEILANAAKALAVSGRPRHAATGEPVVEYGFDGQWSLPPAFESGGDGLAFAVALLARGSHRGERVLSRPLVTLMTSDHLTSAKRGQSQSPREKRAAEHKTGAAGRPTARKSRHTTVT
jgi:hypothetical protein